MRAQLYQIGKGGMVVGRDVKWVVGGTTDRPPLGQDKSAIYNFVVNADRVFTDEELKTIQPRVSISRIILESGKKVRPKKRKRLMNPSTRAVTISVTLAG